MLLDTLTPDELERLAFVQPAHPGVAAALARVAYSELNEAREEIVYLEEQVRSLDNEITEMANAE